MASRDRRQETEPTRSIACGRCHACGADLTGEDWCRVCTSFRRYYEHGYGPQPGVPGGDCLSLRETRTSGH